MRLTSFSLGKGIKEVHKGWLSSVLIKSGSSLTVIGLKSGQKFELNNPVTNITLSLPTSGTDDWQIFSDRGSVSGVLQFKAADDTTDPYDPNTHYPAFTPDY